MSLGHMRIARPVTDLQRSGKMYSAGMGMEKIAEFSHHEGFSGVMLGFRNVPWHVEFTVCHQHPIKPQASPEDLLVLYFPDSNAWEKVCTDMVNAGFICTASFNPYWDGAGKTFVDADGYRTVIQNRAWPV